MWEIVNVRLEKKRFTNGLEYGIIGNVKEEI